MRDEHFLEMFTRKLAEIISVEVDGSNSEK